MFLSTYAQNAILNALLRDSAYTSPVTVYASLYTTDPTDANSGTEVPTGSSLYVREAAAFSAPTGGVCASSSDVVWPVAGTDWGTIAYGGLCDASSGGNLLFHGPLGTPFDIPAGSVFKFPAGEIVASLT